MMEDFDPLLQVPLSHLLYLNKVSLSILGAVHDSAIKRADCSSLDFSVLIPPPRVLVITRVKEGLKKGDSLIHSVL